MRAFAREMCSTASAVSVSVFMSAQYYLMHIVLTDKGVTCYE